MAIQFSAPPRQMDKPAERRLVFNMQTGQFQPHERVERYVRTIPFDWLHRANRLPGHATAVALSLWFLAGVKKNMTFRLTAEAVDLAGCGRKSLYRALTALEQAGLICVLRRPGARPIITVNKQPSPAGQSPPINDELECSPPPRAS